MTFLSVIVSILIITLIVCLHEGGHFLAAKLVGIPVAEYSIGFGPRLLSGKMKETEVSLRAIPLGGYVRFYEDETDALGGITDKALANFPVWKRAVTISAGVVTNVITAFLAVILFLTLVGEPAAANIIAAAEPDSPAMRAGIEEQDVIIALNGVQTPDGQSLVDAIAACGENEMDLTVLRGEKTLQMTVTPFYDAELGRARIGITLGTVQQRVPLFESIAVSGEYIWNLMKEVILSLKMILFGQVESDQIYGIVGTVGVMSEYIRGGLEMGVQFFALISVNLAIMNFLPIPSLDGCKLIFLAIEAVRGKPMDPEKEGLVHLIGFALIALLAIVLTYHDIVRLITGG